MLMLKVKTICKITTQRTLMDAKIVYLRQIPLFKGLSAAEEEQLARIMEPVAKGRYSIIFKPGDASDRLYFLSKGVVKISTHSADGREVIKSVLHPNAMFGERGLIGELERQDFAQALKEEVQLYTIRVSDFQMMMRRNFDLSNQVMQLFGNQLIQTENRLESLLFKDARTRIIEFIKESMADQGRKVGFEMLLKHSLTHQDIANITCTSRQTVTLVLNELKKSDLIHFNRGKILVRDLARLS
jgi:CRP/FNR family cyclic AMP-dependent transcriptional regulator